MQFAEQAGRQALRYNTERRDAVRAIFH